MMNLCLNQILDHVRHYILSIINKNTRCMRQDPAENLKYKAGSLSNQLINGVL